MMNRLCESLVNGFGFAPQPDGSFVREWERVAPVAFIGMMTIRYQVVVRPCASGATRVSYLQDGQLVKEKVYSFGDSRTRNAIRDTVKYAGFEF